MQRANSAVQRIKDSLSYQLGQAITEYNEVGGGIWLLFSRLYRIKKTYQETQSFYRNLIFLHPHLRYPPLEQCEDYKESLKYKFHPHYLLGQALIKAHKQWYKGGYLKFFSYAKEAQRIHKEFKEFDEQGFLETHELALVFEDKTQFAFLKEHKEEFKALLEDINLKEIERLNLKEFISPCVSSKSLTKAYLYLKELRKIFKDFENYEALKSTLKQSLLYIFVFENFNSIKEWLYSKEFKKRYQDKLHPYPSLLDPGKIDYSKIPANLAWEMNLPLPPKYKFIIITSSFSAHAAFIEMLEACEVWGSHHHQSIDAKWHYLRNYELLLSKDFVAINCILYALPSYPDSVLSLERFLFKLESKVPIVCQVRDPITRFVSNLNNSELKKDAQNSFDQNTNLYPFLMERIQFWTCGHHLSLKEKFYLASLGLYQTHKALNFFKNQNFGQIIFIDAKDLSIQNALNTMKELGNQLGFKLSNPENPIFKLQKMEGKMRHIFPIAYKINDELAVLIHYRLDDTLIVVNEFLGLDLSFFEGKLLLQSSRKTLEVLTNNAELLKQTKDKLQDFLDVSIKLTKETRCDEKFVLEELSKDKDFRRELKMNLDREFAMVREFRPDIISSWKYYEEFEKMCEELDG